MALMMAVSFTCTRTQTYCSKTVIILRQLCVWFRRTCIWKDCTVTREYF